MSETEVKLLNSPYGVVAYDSFKLRILAILLIQVFSVALMLFLVLRIYN